MSTTQTAKAALRARMTALGRLGGRKTSAAKAAAVRANGRLGGRPRKAPPTTQPAQSAALGPLVAQGA